MRRLITALALGLALTITPAFTSWAAAGPAPIEDEATAIAPVATLTLSEFTVLVIISLLIPLATGLVTKLQASATVKQVVTAAISTVVGIVTTSTQADGTAVVSLATVQYALLTFAIATVGYLGLYRPHDANAKLAPNSGLG